MSDRSTDPGRSRAGPGTGRHEVELDDNSGQNQDWRHLPVALSGGLSGVVASTRPSLKKPEGPLELFCHEQQRHERIAFMMRGHDHASNWPIDGHVTTRQTPLETHAQNYRQHEDVLMKDSGEAASPKSKHTSSPFRVELEVNGSDNAEDDPHLEAIRIAARIKTERIQRKGQRECREGRVRKKIRMAKRTQPTEPG
ncbi:hypothetical protein FJTKL_08564 [Diaporthe vaccinii]|uniref:Uncharacterized protein n=1 Tax=Diaporthe vaccinii TaxID=105482 RepID=A0ABR4ERU2_9PEZI